MKNLSLAFDKLQKVFYLSFTILSIISFFYIQNTLIGYYGSSISDDINIYSSFLYESSIFIFFIFSIGLLFFVNKMEYSKHNNLGIEKSISKFFKRMKIVEVDNKAYYLFLFFYLSWFTYSLYEGLFLIAGSSTLKTGIDYLAMEKTEYFDYSYIRSMFIIGISLFALITFLVVKPKSKNKDFLFGLLIIPFICSLLNITSLTKILTNDFDEISKVGTSINNEFHNVLNYLNYEFGFVKEFIFFVVVIAVFNYLFQVYKSKKKIKNTVIHLVLGFVVYKAAVLTGAFLFLFSPTIDYLANNENIHTINVEGKEFTIDQTLLTYQDNNMNTEFLLEAYAGLTMHNAQPVLNNLLSTSFEGNKEMAINLSSNILLRNLKKYKENEEKLINLIKTNTIEQSAIINMLIPYIIYENSPIEDQERALTEIIKGNYQNGIDYFIEDAVNRTEERSLKLTMKDPSDQIKTNSFGHPVLQSIIALIVNEGYAEIDYSKVNKDEDREKLKKIISDSLNDSGSVSTERANEWFEMFNTKTFEK